MDIETLVDLIEKLKAFNEDTEGIFADVVESKKSVRKDESPMRKRMMAALIAKA